jgi:ADP-ribose pyrophosphatase YjhB (NUDIX family)
MEWGETVQEALVREVFEETCVEIVPGELFCVYEYLPRADMPYDIPCQTVSLIFYCGISPEAQPHLPEKPDPYQMAVEWVAIDDLENHWVLPELTQEVKAWWHGVNKGIPMVVKRAS